MNLNDLFVLHTGQEDMLLVGIRVESDDVRSFAVGECFDALTCWIT